MSNVFYVINEYETFNNEKPTHAWEVIGKFNTEKEANQVALDMNFKEFCENKPFRWNVNDKKKITSESSNSDKVSVVKYVLENIHSKTGARQTNQYWGRGYFSLGDKDIKLRHNTRKIENINDYLIDKPSEPESDSEDETESESEDEYTEDEDSSDNNSNASEDDIESHDES